MNGFSIIICCYNSATRIEETLRFILELVIPEGKQCEVLVINNNSNDNTSELANQSKQAFQKKNLAFKIIEEPRPGLSFARKTGVEAAAYDIVIFCDDDNHLSSDYLIQAETILTNVPDVAIAGGLAKPKFAIETEPWLIDFYPAMAIGPQAPFDGYVKWVYGAGMVLRKEIFEILEKRNIQFLLSDRSGKSQSSGGDAEICYLTLFLGFKIYYTAKLVLFHATPNHRLKKSHYLKARMNTIPPSVYLFILDELVTNNKARVTQLYFANLGTSIWHLFYFAPRMIFGKHRFYSVFNFYRTFQTLIWLIINPGKFKQFFNQILINLSINR